MEHRLINFTGGLNDLNSINKEIIKNKKVAGLMWVDLKTQLFWNLPTLVQHFLTFDYIFMN